MPVHMGKDVERFTYAHYVTWPAEERWELIDGIPYDMSPAPSRYHQEISMNLGFEISKFDFSCHNKKGYERQITPL